MTASAASWIDANQRSLVAALAEVRGILESHSADRDHASLLAAKVGVDDALETPPSALALMCATLGLSPFERQILVLCAGIELDAAFAGLCAAAQADPRRGFPTFSLALAALDQPHWSALTPEAPLRHWRLVEVVHQPGTPLTLSPLRIDERIL